MAITCPNCKRTSHHPVDELLGWCSACDAFTRGDPPERIRELALQLPPDVQLAVERRLR